MQGQVQRHDVVAEDPLAQRQGLLEVGALVVQPGDRDGAGHPDRGALLPQGAGGRVHAVHGGDDEQRGVRRAQPGPQLPDEVGVPGTVQ